MRKLSVGIVCGGCSREHEISLQSATYIAQSIDTSMFEVIVLWINKKGNWFLVNGKNVKFFSYYDKNQYIPVWLSWCSSRFCFYYHKNNGNNFLKVDVIFPVIHGKVGEDGAIQGFLHIINLPYVGSDILGSSICINKDVTKSLLRDAGLPVVKFKTVLADDCRDSINFFHIVQDFGLPLFIKPVNEGSSIGISKVDSYINFNRALDVAFSYSNRVIIEPCIVGRELECAILGNKNPIASVCGEIILKSNRFYTYYDKYIEYNSNIMIPAAIDNVISDKIRCIAIRAFQVLHCLGMARVDLFLTVDNQIFVNEVNTIPGFTRTSMYPKLWECSGLTTSKLITKLLELALDPDQ